MAFPQISSPPPASAEVIVNENLDALFGMALYAKRAAATTGLTWAYYGGRWGGTSIADGTVTLTNTSDNYIVVLRSTGAVSVALTAANWNNTSAYARVYKVTVAGGVVTAVEDHRAGPGGVFGGAPRERAINSQSAAYGFVMSDRDTIVLHPGADTTARTFTIPSNSSVAYPLGTQLIVINQAGAGVVTIAITTDTMRLAGAGTLGSRSLAANGRAVIEKITSTEWLISGTGVT